MQHTFGAIASALFILAASAPAGFAGSTATPGAETGSGSVLIEGVPAKRAGDIPGAITSPDVFINGQPVIIGCSEGVPILSKSVFVNGKPKVLGCRK